MTATAASELGMLALIDDAKRASALAEVQRGRMYDLGHVLDEKRPGVSRAATSSRLW